MLPATRAKTNFYTRRYKLSSRLKMNMRGLEVWLSSEAEGEDYK